MTFKRIFDLVLVIPGLLLLSPLFLVVAVWIKCDSKGPVFFRQERVGRNSKIFKIFKFRTMVVNAESLGEKITVGEDPRITSSGKFLRKYKIDELPQLIDVLIGQMSLVGPRPEVPEYMDMYPDDIRDKVLSVRPGITDLASIKMIDEDRLLGQYNDARNGYVDNILPIKQQYYLEYVDNMGFWLDVKIILETIIRVIVR